ncbi:cytochrome-c peroxidase [Spongiivirga citrea]|uniref:Methylamine utilization protein n=1 Tax=Spongiivirga citrea TaxID=1481457 RepID=A0A6M0CKL0_9FLAO|nr:cytochrome c peroxidase [Spongiivirga citrea]NER16504.1 methylamine utilization protein [Spongiivirga citrea]
MLLGKLNGAYVIISLFLLLIGCKKEKETITEKKDLNHKLQERYQEYLALGINALDKIANTKDIDSAKILYKEARKQFKYAEPILAYIDAENYKFLNQPNITKVEEDDFTDIKIKKPSGFQVLEETIFADEPELNEIHFHSVKTKNRLVFTKNNADLSFLKDHHILWIIRDALMRVSLTGVTGFDSPVLENSLAEGQWVYRSVQDIISMHKERFSNSNLLTQWNNHFEKTVANLTGEFNSFDRYSFMKNHTFTGLLLFNKTVDDWNVSFPFNRSIKNDVTSLYSDKTFNLSYFSGEKFDSLNVRKIALGKQLFHDKDLSNGKAMSCATCHNPKKQYTDGLKIGKKVSRNTPTLLYASLQKGFFYDNRSGSLEGQIISVVENENEFHSNLKHVEEVVNQNKEYVVQFDSLYRQGANELNIRNAIATFIRSLTPFNSKVDKNLNGIESTLTESEINGFNLFHGKAKCATCHFPPSYNGTVPILYKESEMELIGIPKFNDTINAIVDTDLGAYEVYKTEERKYFFKTSTIRNVDMTGPYMHNGVYNTLEEVVDFYNRGGGAGIGINLEAQTLPPDALKLSKNEVNDLVLFMKALSDPIE